MKMITPEKILQTMNSWQSGEVIAVRRKKCSGASSRPNMYNNMTTIPDFQDVTEVNIQDEATTVFSRAKQVRVNR